MHLKNEPGACRQRRACTFHRIANVIGLAALLLPAPAHAATRYVFATFKGNAAADEKLWIYTSNDAQNFTLFRNTGYGGPTGVLRDPSIMKHTDGKYYIAHTIYSWDTNSTEFAIASSPDLSQWTHLTMVGAGTSDVRHTWAPEWFKDTDGSVRILVNVDGAANESFRTLMFTATNDALTAWSGPVAIGIGPNYIDTFVVKAGSTYHAFAKNETSKYIEHATASTLTGPWTWIGTGNWAGWGSGKEGPALFQLDDGTWRMFMDCYSGCGFLYTSSTTLSSWSSYATVTSLNSVSARHGTVLREEMLDDGGVVDSGSVDSGQPDATTEGGAGNGGGGQGGVEAGVRDGGGGIQDSGGSSGSDAHAGAGGAGGSVGSGGVREAGLASGGGGRGNEGGAGAKVGGAGGGAGKPTSDAATDRDMGPSGGGSSGGGCQMSPGSPIGAELLGGMALVFYSICRRRTARAQRARA